jgi:hypothetical protein
MRTRSAHAVAAVRDAGGGGGMCAAFVFRCMVAVTDIFNWIPEAARAVPAGKTVAGTVRLMLCPVTQPWQQKHMCRDRRIWHLQLRLCVLQMRAFVVAPYLSPTGDSESRLHWQSMPSAVMNAVFAIVGGLSVDGALELVRHRRFGELEAIASRGMCFMPRLDATTKAIALAVVPPFLVLAVLGIIGVCHTVVFNKLWYRHTGSCRAFLLVERCCQCCMRHGGVSSMCTCRSRRVCFSGTPAGEATAGVDMMPLLPRRSAAAIVPRRDASGGHRAAAGPVLVQPASRSDSDFESCKCWSPPVCPSRFTRRRSLCKGFCQRFRVCAHNLSASNDVTSNDPEDSESGYFGVCIHVCCNAAYVRAIAEHVDVRCFDEDVSDSFDASVSAAGSNRSGSVLPVTAAAELEGERMPVSVGAIHADSGGSAGHGGNADDSEVTITAGDGELVDVGVTLGGLVCAEEAYSQHQRCIPESGRRLRVGVAASGCERRTANRHNRDAQAQTAVLVTREEYIQTLSRPGDNAKLLSTSTRVVVLLVDFLQLVYLRAFALALLLLNCVRLPGATLPHAGDGSAAMAPRYRFIDATVRCGPTASASSWLPFLLTALLAAVNGVLAAWMARSVLRLQSSPHRRRDWHSLSTLQRGVYRALMMPYKQQYLWWEAALFVQRALLAALQSLNDVPSARAVGAAVVCMVSLVVHEKHRPFRSPTSHSVQTCFLMALVLTSLAQMPSLSEASDVATLLEWVALALATAAPALVMVRSYLRQINVTCGRTGDSLYHAQRCHRAPTRGRSRGHDT